MKTLICYCTSHGCTEKAVKELQNHLDQEVTICNLKKENHPLVDEFETIIVGGSIHAGQIQKRVKSFCKKNLPVLKEKELGLFVCCMEEGEKAWQQFREAYPDELIQKAKATAIFGGEFNFDRMNFAEKYIIRKIGNVTGSISRLDHSAIQEFASKMKESIEVG